MYTMLGLLVIVLVVLVQFAVHVARTDPRDSRAIAERELQLNSLQPGEHVVRMVSVFKRPAINYFRATRGLLALTNQRLLYIGLEPRDLLAAPDLPPTFEERDFPIDTLVRARNAALAKNPTITQLALQESMLNLNIDIERANHFPTLALFGSYTWQAQDNSFHFRNYNWANTFNVGLNLSFPLFDGFRTSARVDQANVDLQKLKYTRLKVEEGLRIQIQSAELRMAEAKQRIEGQEKTIAQAEKAVRIAQTRFKSGVGTQLELLDTQVAMTRAQTNYAQAIYDHLLAKAEWQRAAGLAGQAGE